MSIDHIPNRVPVGTKYIVQAKSHREGEVHIYSRYLVFPDGRCFDLSPDPQEFALGRAAAVANPRKH